MNPEPQTEHRWLLKLTGDWTFEAEAGTSSSSRATTTGC